MSFTYPAVLYALAFLSIPILIHLFNFQQYKKLRFTQVEFLKKISQHSRSSSKLKHLLVLLARLLAFACLILAFAKPFIIQNDQANVPGKKGVCFYLDNSFSMGRNAEEGTILDLALQKTEEIVSAYDETDQFMLISNAFSSDEITWHNKSSFLEKLRSIQLNPNFRLASDVFKRLLSLTNHSELEIEYYFISDFQKSSFDYSQIQTDSASINLIPLVSSKVSNVYLDSIWFKDPFQVNQQNQSLSYKLKQHGKSEYEDIEVKLYLNQKLKAPGIANFNSRDSIIEQLNFRLEESKINFGKVFIKDYPINFDDTLYFNLTKQVESRVLHLTEEKRNERISAVFMTDSSFIYQASSINQIDYSQFAQQDLIILDELKKLSSGLVEEIKSYVFSGGSLLLIPSNDLKEEPYGNLCKMLSLDAYEKLNERAREVSYLNENARLFKSVFEEVPKNIILPKVEAYYTLNSQSRNLKEKLLSFKTGEDFLIRCQVQDGQVFQLSSAINPNNSNFSDQAIFVPVLYNMALIGRKILPSNYFIGSQANIQSEGNSEEVIHLKRDNFDLIPKQNRRAKQVQINLDHPDLIAGHYELVQAQSSLGWISLNYKRQESNIDCYLDEDLERLVEESGLDFKLYATSTKNLGQDIKNRYKGIQLWKYFLISALFFLGIEIALLRILK